MQGGLGGRGMSQARPEGFAGEAALLATEWTGRSNGAKKDRQGRKTSLNSASLRVECAAAARERVAGTSQMGNVGSRRNRMNIPKKVCERMVSGMKTMKSIIEQQRTRDVSEADTVTLVKDLLAEVFGYDKYADLTSEHSIRGTYCDLAIKIDDKLAKLVEVKAIGITLEDRHVKQAVDYAANQGVEWVVLTNGIAWRLYHVLFSKPIDKQLIGELDLMAVNCRDEAQQEILFLFTKEGFKRGAQAEMRDRKDATSRYVLSALILHNESVLNAIRRELRRVVEVNVDEEDIANVLRDQVIKRDALEGPEAEVATRRVQRRSERSIVKERVKDSETPTDVSPSRSSAAREAETA